MSALPPKADIVERDRHVRFVLKADINLAIRFDRWNRYPRSGKLQIFNIPDSAS
jgi:hypothetical protein